MTIVTDNREHICPIIFTWQRAVTQNNELLIQIALIGNSFYICNHILKGKNTEGNNNMALNKDMPDQPIVMFTVPDATGIRKYFG